ncbi:MAG: hypothetical protein K2O30_01230 [Duncaniella sp.]|nr:hypothetical protein [Duncaniella sp.]MDE7144759.1 hypothetical protein [Duncaniella sp.]
MLKMDILEAIRTRVSVRSYSGAALTDEQAETLKSASHEISAPFGGSVTIRLKGFDLEGAYKPSTYGIITGAHDFLLMALGNDESSALSGGFLLEHVVLKATGLGLGTCWIAATFRGSDFEKGMTWNNGESLRIICPVGIPSAKRSLKERLMRFAVRSNKRNPFNELFFRDNFSAPLDDDNRFAQSLAMMRLAPSSTNSQPWRATVNGDTVHFYYKPKSHLSVLDCGIGLYHFVATERYHHRPGNFLHSPTPPSAPDDWIYLISYSTCHTDDAEATIP